MAREARAVVPPVPTSAPHRDAQLLDRTLIAAMPIDVRLVAPDRTIRLANRMAEETFALPRTGRLPASILRNRPLLDRIEMALRAGPVGFGRLLSLSRTGESHLREHVRTFGASEGVLVAIENRKQALGARELHRDFVANASHELKTPPAVMAGIIDTLRGHARDDAAAMERLLGVLAEQSQRMSRLVEDSPLAQPHRA